MAQTAEDETSPFRSLWSRLVSQFPKFSKPQIISIRDSLDEILEEFDGDAAMAPEERTLIENILTIGTKTASDVMIPRADIVAFPKNIKLTELTEAMTQHPHSRYPVFGEDMDSIEGMIHVKDVFAAINSKANKQTRASIKRMLRPILFIAPKMPVLDLLLEMRRSKMHIGVVVDEYGGVDGLITIEDLVEEIVGEIEDEYDTDSQHSLELLPDGSYRASARVSLELVTEEIGQFLTAEEQEEDIDTLGGLIYHLCGRIPSRGELIRHAPSGIEFTIIRVDPRRIRSLTITLPNQG